jgi:hypothetical protein
VLRIWFPILVLHVTLYTDVFNLATNVHVVHTIIGLTINATSSKQFLITDFLRNLILG